MTAIRPYNGTSQPQASFGGNLKDTPYDTGYDLNLLRTLPLISEDLPTSMTGRPNPNSWRGRKYPCVPGSGGMLSNLMSQLKSKTKRINLRKF